MENRVEYNACFRNAQMRAREEVQGGFILAKATVAAFTVVAIEGKYWHNMSTRDERSAHIKAAMLTTDMSNGKAAAYSKIVERFMSQMVKAFGQPDAAEVSQFWAEWRDAADVAALEAKALGFIESAAPVDTVGALADVVGVSYGDNKAARATKAILEAKAAAKAARGKGPARKAPAPLSTVAPAVVAAVVADVAARHDAAVPEGLVIEAPEAPAAAPEAPAQGRVAVLAALLALSPADQAWVFDAHAATLPKVEVALAS